MTSQEQQRFDMLRQGPLVSPEFIQEYYGLTWPFAGELAEDYEMWLRSVRRQANGSAGLVSRVELESFMQRKQVLPKKWMAARLGMQESSLDALLERLRKIGMRPQRHIIYPEFISDSLSEDLIPNVPGLRFRTFSDHIAFCRQLHQELTTVLGTPVKELFCATSERLGDYPRQYAHDFDCITLLPLSGKHQLWLDFRKPLNLGPDRCSKLFFVENRPALEAYRAGTREPDLEPYEQFLAVGRHG